MASSNLGIDAIVRHTAGKAPARESTASSHPRDDSLQDDPPSKRVKRAYHELYEDRLNELTKGIDPTCTIICGAIRIPAHKAVLRKSAVIRRAFGGNFKESRTSEYVFDGALEHALALLYWLYTYQYLDDEATWNAFVNRFEQDEAIRNSSLHGGELRFHLAMFALAQYHGLQTMQTSAYECCLLLLATQKASIFMARELGGWGNVFHFSMQESYDVEETISLCDEKLAADFHLIMLDETFVRLAPIRKLLVHLILARKDWPRELMPLPECLASVVLQLAGDIAFATRVTRDEVCPKCEIPVEEVCGSQTGFEEEKGDSGMWVTPKYCIACLALESQDKQDG